MQSLLFKYILFLNYSELIYLLTVKNTSYLTFKKKFENFFFVFGSAKYFDIWLYGQIPITCQIFGTSLVKIL